MTGLVEEERAVVVVYLDFRKAFDTDSPKILIEELTKYGLDEWTVDWKVAEQLCQEDGDAWQQV